MAESENWIDVGAAAELSASPLMRVAAGNRELAISVKDGTFGAVANSCNHAGGPLGDGRLDGDYIVCPWHNWKFHRCSGVGEPGYEEDRVPAYPVKVEKAELFTARWVRGPDNATLKAFEEANRVNMADDHDGEPVFLARNAWHLNRTVDDNPKITFLKTRELVQ